VFLVGFMGSGKTTVGQELARRLGWDFVDLDAEIERRERSTIAQIFGARGEAAFRNSETAALRESLANPRLTNSVFALGGGAFVEKSNRALVGHWPTVFLDAPAGELWRRCEQDGVARPLRKDRSQFARLYEARLPFYRQASLTIATAGKSAAAICAEIESALHLRESTQAHASKSAHPASLGPTGSSSSSPEGRNSRRRGESQ